MAKNWNFQSLSPELLSSISFLNNSALFRCLHQTSFSLRPLFLLFLSDSLLSINVTFFLRLLSLSWVVMLVIWGGSASVSACATLLVCLLPDKTQQKGLWCSTMLWCGANTPPTSAFLFLQPPPNRTVARHPHPTPPSGTGKMLNLHLLQPWAASFQCTCFYPRKFQCMFSQVS